VLTHVGAELIDVDRRRNRSIGAKLAIFGQKTRHKRVSTYYSAAVLSNLVTIADFLLWKLALLTLSSCCTTSIDGA
jgi:hypothetical protein